MPFNRVLWLSCSLCIAREAQTLQQVLHIYSRFFFFLFFSFDNTISGLQLKGSVPRISNITCKRKHHTSVFFFFLVLVLPDNKEASIAFDCFAFVLSSFYLFFKKKCQVHLIVEKSYVQQVLAECSHDRVFGKHLMLPSPIAIQCDSRAKCASTAHTML